MDPMTILSKVFHAFRRFSPAVKVAVLASIGAAALILIITSYPKNGGNNTKPFDNNPTKETSSSVPESAKGQTSAPSPQVQNAQMTEQEQREEEEMQKVKRDPGLMKLYNEANKKADEYWRERFTECGKGRWFTVVRTDLGDKYLEVTDVGWLTNKYGLPVIPYPRTSADERNQIYFFGVSELHGLATRECLPGEPPKVCSEKIYEGTYVGGYLAVLHLKNDHGEWFLEPVNQELAAMVAPSCEEIKNHPIWKTP